MDTALDVVRQALPATLGDGARYAAAIDVVTGVLAERREAIRAQLFDQLAEAAAAEGVDGASRKLAGLGTLTLTAPEAKPKVTDPQAFGTWLAANPDAAAELGLTAEVAVDQGWDEARLDDAVATATRIVAQGAGSAARTAELGRQLADELLNAVTTSQRWALPEDTDKLLAASPAVRVVPPHDAENGRRPGRCYYTGTGEQLPGVEVSQARQVLTLKIDGKVKDAEAGRLREVLGW